MQVLLSPKVNSREGLRSKERSRKGAFREDWSEVSGTAKVGKYEQESHKRHRGVVKVAQHTGGWLFTKPARVETKASDVDAGRFS